MRELTIYLAGMVIIGLTGPAAAQSFTKGQVVFATPSNAYNDWRQGCVVGAGRSNTSYQIRCGADWMWIDASQISVTKPQPKPDPNNPDRMLVPVIRPNPNYVAKPTTSSVLVRSGGVPRNRSVNVAASSAGIPDATSLPPSGRYVCEDGNGQQLGALDIQGVSYRGIAFSPAGAFHPFAASAGGALTFSAGLGAFERAAARIGRASYNGTQGSSGHRPWISIAFVTTRGENERLDCERQ